MTDKTLQTKPSAYEEVITLVIVGVSLILLAIVLAIDFVKNSGG